MMQAAVYSRFYDPAQQAEWQMLFDEMEHQGIRPVIFRDFYDQLSGALRLPDSSGQFTCARSPANADMAITKALARSSRSNLPTAIPPTSPSRIKKTLAAIHLI